MHMYACVMEGFLYFNQDERARLMRRTVMRYVNLCFVITCTMLSTQTKARFPTLDHLVEAGVK